VIFEGYIPGEEYFCDACASSWVRRDGPDPSEELVLTHGVLGWPGSTGTMKIESSLFLTFFTAKGKMGF
jgi:hypothetical protein